MSLKNGGHNRGSLKRGFALPTILIASIAMLSVLLSAITTVSSIRAALKDQQYNQLSKLTSEAGEIYARSCLDANNGVSLWAESKPLTVNTDCAGNQLPGFTCPSDDVRCSFVKSNDNSLATSFRVGVKESPAPNSWNQISAGMYHSCAVDSSDKAYCWGENSNGQVGDGSFLNRSIAIAVDNTGVLSAKTIKSVASGNKHTCAIASDNKVYCWGNNDYGQLGDNSNNISNTPVAVAVTGTPMADKDVASISAGGNFTCAVDTLGVAYCWG